MGDKRRLASVFEALGGINLNTLRNRKILQKQIYFLEQFGLDLGYDFNFYMYGPYSPSATKEAFELQEQQNIAPHTIEALTLSDDDLSVIRRLNEFLDEIPGERRAYMLELLSAIHYISHLPYVAGETREEIESRLRKMKPDFEFTEKELESAWTLLKRFNLIDS